MSALSFASEVVSGQGGSPTVSHEGGRTVVWLAGEHDIATLPLVADLLGRAGSAGDGDMIVDLSGVTFLSLGTVSEFVNVRNLIRPESRGLFLRAPSRCVTRLLDACRLNGLLETATPAGLLVA